MNRGIKLRAWSEQRKTMYFSDNINVEFLLSVDDLEVTYWENKGALVDMGQNIEIVPFPDPDYIEDAVVMLFTGLLDRHNKQVYQSDVVETDYGRGLVEYSGQQAMFIISWIDDPETNNESLAYCPRDYKQGRTRTDLRVIGNKYQNPELLKRIK